METAARHLTFLLAEPERRTLRWTAARLPRSWTPNRLTAIGVGGALVVGAGYALARFHPAWFWLASLGLAVNWFGDSLDGTLARVRHIERPKYGYYIDHMVDAFNTAVIGAGIGLSGYVSLPLAMLLVIIYLALSINVYLESSVLGVFDLGYGIFGPTEIRLLLVLVNAGLFAGASWAGLAAPSVAAIGNAVLAAVCVMMVLSLAARFAKNLSRLARLEPARRG
jgi:phosphatidylglycerophosphate synthase